MKVAILVNEDTMGRCTGKGCFNAFNNKTDAFADYGSDVELVEFTHIGGDLELLIESLIKNEVDVVHLSTCLRSKNVDYESLAYKLSQYFKVIGYTHGSEKGRTRDAINLDKNSYTYI
jgi:predicted metal-binding protein